jgi:hypothetical protein
LLNFLCIVFSSFIIWFHKLVIRYVLIESKEIGCVLAWINCLNPKLVLHENQQNEIECVISLYELFDSEIRLCNLSYGCF